MKPSESIKSIVDQIVRNSVPPGASRQELAIARLDALPVAIAQWLDESDVMGRLAKLEALNPDVRDVVGSTASGATVHGLRPTDGKPDPEFT